MNLSPLKTLPSSITKGAYRAVTFPKTVINHVEQPICAQILVSNTVLHPKETRVPL